MAKTIYLKYLVLSLITLFFIAFLFLYSHASAETTVATVDPQVAESTVSNWLSQNNLSKKKLKEFAGQKVKKSHPFNDSSGNLLAYVIDLDPAGFAIVPKSEAVEPILYFNLDGSFDGTNDDKNPLSYILSRDIPDRIKNYEKLDADVKEKIKKKWQLLNSPVTSASADNLVTAVVPTAGPLLTTRWDQGYPYNYYAPNNYWAGCVAVAYAQVIKYYRYPASAWNVDPYRVNSGEGQFGYFGSSYNYNNMPNTLSGASQSQIEETAKLIRDAGYSTGMNYTSQASSAYAEPRVLKYVFNFESADKKEGTDPGWRTDFQNEIKAGYPLLLGIGSAQGAHEVVADGLANDGIVNYYHINMGWGGLDDGWYNLPDFTAGYHWTVLLDYIYNIRVKRSPVYEPIPPPPSTTNLSIYMKMYDRFSEPGLTNFLISWVNKTPNAISTNSVRVEDVIPAGMTYRFANGWDYDIISYDQSTHKVTWQVKSPFMKPATGQLPAGSFGRLWLQVNY